MAVYALTIFIGAFLLFQVQPLIGKFILPWFGGGPGVWTACLLFFQALLLAGYAYTHYSTRWLRPRAQAVVHLLLLLGALALLPITPGDAWKPKAGGNPTLQILVLLSACLGLPYFVLSTTGPLVQQWFSRAQPGRSPYRLYALSNAGSLAALLSYPFFFETRFTRQTQATLWAAGLVAYVLCCAWCVLQAARPRSEKVSGIAPDGSPSAAHASGLRSASRTSNIPRPASREWQTALLWLLLPACASVLLLATTNKLCQDVAVVPFLWVLPLALYLLSFIICFDNPRWYARLPFTLALMAALAGICWAMIAGRNGGLRQQIAIYCGGLFVCCMVCHGELYRLRPDPRRLTSFYLAIAAGGALGGFFVAVIAPLIFARFYELHSGLLLCGALLLAVSWKSKPRLLQRDPQDSKGVGRLPEADSPPAQEQASLNRPGRFGFRLCAVGHPQSALSILLLATLIGITAILWHHERQSDGTIVAALRNFYGILTVTENRKADPQTRHFRLEHGRITHGWQFTERERAAWPTLYYGEKGGGGLAFQALPSRNRRVGLVGLGIGTMAAYARPGDDFRFYEINPQVLRVANSWFTYLSNCQGKVEVVLGDARLSLEREPPQRFDLLVLDAFSSDAIPVHLLTEEAFALYERHLKPEGLIAMHITNGYLDLEPVIVNLACRFRYAMTIVERGEGGDKWWNPVSTWALLTHRQQTLEAPAILEAARPPHEKPARLPLWTDDFASLYQIMR